MTIAMMIAWTFTPPMLDLRCYNGDLEVVLVMCSDCRNILGLRDCGYEDVIAWWLI
jgi:hypothetical protein